MIFPGSLNGSVVVEGIGIHTGESCRVTIEPGTQEDGIVFVRGFAKIPARAELVTDTSRCTKISADGESVSTIEHLMSALVGLGVPWARITVDGPELPILDGSAQGWVKAIRPATIAPLGMLPTKPISEPITVEGRNGSYISATPSDKLSITLTIEYDHPVIGTQTAMFVEGDDYAKEIAPARTFGLRSEVDALLAAGLAKGGSLDNAVIVEEDGYSTPLRFPNELARHKILDLLGDLYLSGGLPKADIIAVKPSHTLNVALAARLFRGR